jgi:beta-glucanase (GH16 family)
VGGGTWACTFSDAFDGDLLDPTKWTVQKTAGSRFTNGGECFVDSPANVSVSGGSLHLTLRRKATPVRCPGLGVSPTTHYTSGSVTTFGKFAQAYGRFEFRARFPTASVAGLHSALWLWPQQQRKYGPRPASGEIDVAEYYSAYPDRVIPYLHYVRATPSHAVTDIDCLVARPDRFHIYTLEWTPDTMTIAYDGETCLTTSWQATALVRPAPFDMPFFVNLTQALGSTRNLPSAATPLPATMDVDYVRVWS